jgi:glycerol transport system substrate-binding protein
MKLKYSAIAFAAAALVLGQSAWAGEAEAKNGWTTSFSHLPCPKTSRWQK